MHILFTCLNQCLETTPKESKRFTQRMFDAIGDLGVGYGILLLVRYITSHLGCCEASRYAGVRPRGRMGEIQDNGATIHDLVRCLPRRRVLQLEGYKGYDDDTATR